MPTKAVCQDTHRWQYLDDEILLITVADGAGMAPRAEHGSDLASRTAQDYVVVYATSTSAQTREQDWHALVQGAMGAAIAALHAESATQGVPVDYYATTLMVVLATPQLVVIAQVGDGMVFIADLNGTIIPLTTPQRGEYSNETCMLTSLSAYDSIQTVAWKDPITGIAAMTDGLLPITTTLPFYQPYSPFFTYLFAFLRKTEDTGVAREKLKTFLLSDRVQDGTGDDLTLVLAVPTEMPTPTLIGML